MTVIGHKKLEEELKSLKTVERPKVIAAIAEARSHGDLSENAEYDAAKDRQAFLEGRIAEIEDKIARAQVIDTSEVRSDRIVFGATVELMDVDSEEKKTYRIVGTDEADIKLGLLSIESPIARQLLNKSAGDQVIIRVPKGDVEYEILSVRYE
ncbi:MAG: transcription elongation factor GreA [Deltaproteobacteria bacterium]|nr:transcription elongation factor GreA [Deltaproteobacteria bacterium]